MKVRIKREELFKAGLLPNWNGVYPDEFYLEAEPVEESFAEKPAKIESLVRNITSFYKDNPVYESSQEMNKIDELVQAVNKLNGY